MVTTFLHEWLFVVGVIVAFGTCGFGILVPFARSSRYWLLAAPFAGLVIVPFGANTFYSLLVVPYARAAWMSAAGCVLLGVAAWLFYRGRLPAAVAARTVTTLGLLAAVVAAAAVVVCEGATLHVGGPAIYASWGSDHFGYAHLADWLNSRQVTQLPQYLPTADRPYDSWPAVMFANDPRFGAFGFLAIVSAIYGTSGIFAYDVANAIALAAAILALAAVFGGTIIAFSLVGLGLLFCHWIDYAHLGFFGKALGYPAALFVSGLALHSLRLPSPDRVAALIILAAAAATLHSGLATSLLTGAALVPALAAIAIHRNIQRLSGAIFMCGLVILVPVIASGIQARPISFGFPDWHFAWPQIFPRILDLDSQIGNISGLGPAGLCIAVAIAMLTWMGLLALAVRQGSLPALGMLGGPALLLFVLLTIGARTQAYQLIGYFYPAVVCGAGCLVIGTWPWKQAALALLALAIGERGPRFAGAVKHFVVSPSQPYLLSKAEFDRMAENIGPSSVVEVDIVNPQRVIAVLVEFGARRINVQWTARAWKTILGYRPWPVPTYLVQPSYLLTDSADIMQRGKVVHESPRYRLGRVD